MTLAWCSTSSARPSREPSYDASLRSSAALLRAVAAHSVRLAARSINVWLLAGHISSLSGAALPAPPRFMSAWSRNANGPPKRAVLKLPVDNPSRELRAQPLISFAPSVTHLENGVPGVPAVCFLDMSLHAVRGLLVEPCASFAMSVTHLLNGVPGVPATCFLD